MMMNFRFDNDEIDAQKKKKICVEYLLIRRSSVLKENGIAKEFLFLVLVGYRSYLKSATSQTLFFNIKSLLQTPPENICFLPAVHSHPVSLEDTLSSSEVLSAVSTSLSSNDTVDKVVPEVRLTFFQKMLKFYRKITTR